MLGKGLSRRCLALEAANAGGLLGGGLSDQGVFAGVAFELLELRLHLVETAVGAFGALLKSHPPRACCAKCTTALLKTHGDALIRHGKRRARRLPPESEADAHQSSVGGAQALKTP